MRLIGVCILLFLEHGDKYSAFFVRRREEETRKGDNEIGVGNKKGIRSSLKNLIVLGTTSTLLSGCASAYGLQSDGAWDVYSPSTDLFQDAFGEGSIYQTVRGIVTFVAVVALAFAGMRLIVSDNPRDAQIAKRWIISIFAGLILFWLVPIIFGADQVNSWLPH